MIWPTNLRLWSNKNKPVVSALIYELNIFMRKFYLNLNAHWFHCPVELHLGFRKCFTVFPIDNEKMPLMCAQAWLEAWLHFTILPLPAYPLHQSHTLFALESPHLWNEDKARVWLIGCYEDLVTFCLQKKAWAFKTVPDGAIKFSFIFTSSPFSYNCVAIVKWPSPLPLPTPPKCLNILAELKYIRDLRKYFVI